MNKPYFVRAEWDDEAAVWVATSDDVPGLVTEAQTIEALDAKLKSMVPELLEANGCMPPDGQVAVELLARRFSVALPAAARSRSGTTFPVDHKILSRHTANGVLKQAGLPKQF